MFQTTTDIYQTDIRNEFVRMLVLHLLICLNLSNHCEIAVLSLSYNHHFGKWSTELAELSPFHLSYAWCAKYASCCFTSDCNSLSVNATTFKFNNKKFETLKLCHISVLQLFYLCKRFVKIEI